MSKKVYHIKEGHIYDRENIDQKKYNGPIQEKENYFVTKVQMEFDYTFEYKRKGATHKFLLKKGDEIYLFMTPVEFKAQVWRSHNNKEDWPNTFMSRILDNLE